MIGAAFSSMDQAPTGKASPLSAIPFRGASCEIEYRIKTPDGEVRWESVRGQVSRDFDGIPYDARERLEFLWLERIEDAVAAGLEERRAPAAAAE